MTRLSDEEIVNKCFVIPRMALPTEKADTVRGWKHAEVFYIPQIEKLQGEIEQLSQSNLSLKQLVKDIAEYSIEEIARLTAKHERLVKAAQEFHDYLIIHPVKAFDVPDEIYVPFNNALTEEGNV